jgi:asparagine synthase (glutamine-hydrolysing)
VARHLGTEHTEITVTARDALDVIPRLPAIYDEPFGDSSQIPTVLLAELTRRHVTVCLSGDGGDEVFGGYARYFMGERLWRHLRMLPAPVRSGLAGLLEQIRPPSWNRLERLQRRLLWQLSGFPGRAGLTGLTGLTGLASRIPKLVEALRSSTPAAFYERFLEHWPAASNVVLGAAPATESGITPGMAGLAAFWGGVPWAEVPDLGMIPGMMLADTLHYLPDDILVKVDRAAMAASLETRVPFLDHELVEWAWSLPLSLKVRDGQGKWLLRQVLYRYVPRDLVDRPKCGFGVPLADWLRGPLRAWAGDLLAEDRLRREGFFDPRPIRQLWDEHARGVKDHQSRLWLILQFETWLERQREGL